MSQAMDRRTFMGIAASAAVALPAFGAVQGDAAKPVRVGVVGTGNRGGSLTRNMLKIPGIQVKALCDIDTDALARVTGDVTKAGQPAPAQYSAHEESFRDLMARDDLDAVVIATPWDWHTQMAVCGMENGKYTAVEVPAAMAVEECWALVDTHEKTGVPCMMLENWSFRQDNLAILNMIRLGMMGEIVHCHCAHSHDCVDHWFFDREGNIRWGGEFLVKYNRDQYPTHSVGPVLSWMDINCGDNFATIASTATASKGINAHFARKFGPDHPNATRKYAQGDIVTSTLTTHGGKTLIVNYDMQLPRPYDNRWMIQGTEGLYDEARDAVYLLGQSPEYHQWESSKPYREKYDHAWWKAMKDAKGAGGHGGTDYLELSKFFEAVRNGTQTPIDVYDSASMSCIVGLSGESIAQGSIPIECPDFTRGKWKTTKPKFAVDSI